MRELVRHKKYIVLLLFVLLASTVRFFIISYDTALEIYPDELIYYNIAKDLYHHSPLSIHGNLFSLQNIAYSIFLMPFMLIENSVIRIRVIMFANALILSSCAFPVFLICREISLEKKYRWMSVLIILLWPDMSMNATLMAENLYWPLVLWTIYFFIKFMKTESAKFSIPAAIFSYMSYFCKEVGICLPLALISCYIIYYLIQRIFWKQTVKINRQFFWSLLAYYGTFAGLFVLIKQLFFAGNINLYTNTLFGNALSGTYNIMYFLYSLIYYLLAIILAFGIFPIIYMIGFYKYLDKITQKLTIFSLVFLTGSALMIVFMITVREDLGAEIPRIHLRYIAVFAAILMPLFFKVIQTLRNVQISNICKKRILFWLSLIMVSLFFQFKGPGVGVSIEHSALTYYDVVREHLGTREMDLDNAYIFYLYVIVINLFLIFFVFSINYQMLYKNTIKYFITAIIIVNCVNNYAVTKKIYMAHTVDSFMIAEMSDINDWFHRNNMLQENILYIGDANTFSKYRKIFDTYFDGTNITAVSSVQFSEQLLEKELSNIEEYTFIEPLFGKPYEDVTNINYIIIENAEMSGLALTDVNEITELSGNTYKVYQNRDKDKLNIKSLKSELDINFFGDAYNCLPYVLQGISWMENGYSWTDGREFEMNVPIKTTSNSVHIRISVVGTYNGDQAYMVLSEGNCILSDVLNGAGEIEFDLPVTNKNISYQILLPNAVSPKSIGENDDPRILAIKISKVSIVFQ